jgi:hypothetical protein
MLGKSLVPAIAAGLLAVLIPAGSAHAQAQNYCPDGFNWERMSGQCCVQDRSTLPPHGKIGYTGNSLCQDGWFEVYERRSTPTDEGPPGCPGYTSYVFLLECASSREEAAQRQAAVDAEASGNPITPLSPVLNSGGASINPVSDSLYGSGGMPSPEDLALAGGIAGSLLATLGASTLRGSGGAASDRRTRNLLDQLRANEREFEEAQQALDKATEERNAIDRQRTELQQVASELQTRLDNLVNGLAQCDRNITIANYGKWTLAGLGLVAAIASFAAWAFAAPAAGTAATTGGGMASFEAALGSLGTAVEKVMMDLAAATAKLSVSAATFVGGLEAHFSWSAPWQRLKESTNSLRANASFLRGRVQGELDNLNRAYDQADAHVKEAAENLSRISDQGAQISQQIASP